MGGIAGSAEVKTSVGVVGREERRKVVKEGLVKKKKKCLKERQGEGRSDRGKG